MRQACTVVPTCWAQRLCSRGRGLAPWGRRQHHLSEAAERRVGERRRRALVGAGKGTLIWFMRDICCMG